MAFPKVILITVGILLLPGTPEAQYGRRKDSLEQALRASAGPAAKAGILESLSAMTRNRNTDSSLIYALRQLDMARQSKDPRLLMKAHYNIGRAYAIQDKFNLAAACFLESLKIAEASRNDEWIGLNRLFLALLKVEFSDKSTALRDFRLAYAASERARDTVTMAWTLTNLASISLSQRDTAAAEAYTIRSVRFAEAMRDTSQSAIGWAALGDLLTAQGRYAAAQQYYSRAYRYYSNRQDRFNLSLTLRQQAYLASARGNYSESARLLRQAIRLSSAVHSAEETGQNLRAISEAYVRLGDYRQAFRYRTWAERLKDSLYEANNSRRIVEMQMQHEFDSRSLADSLRAAQVRQAAALQLRQQRLYTYFGSGSALCLLLLLLLAFRNYRNQRRANAALSLEKQKSEALLLNILPEEVAEELKAKGEAQARLFDGVSVMFTDFVSFTRSAERMSPQELVNELHSCFKAFDQIISQYGIEKIKTIGDAYLAVCGVPHEQQRHAHRMVQAALEIRDFMRQRKEALGDRTFDIRIGIHSGPVVAGIVGLKKFAYDIWGDTVNTAARMEQNSEPGRINVSRITYELIRDEYSCIRRGRIAAKNKGEIDMYFVEAEAKAGYRQLPGLAMTGGKL